jgi:hypothetical protein
VNRGEPEEGREELMSFFFREKKSETHLGVAVNFQPSRRCIESGDFRDVVVFVFMLLLLELEGNTADGASLDTLHQMGGSTGDFSRRRFEGTTAYSDEFQGQIHNTLHILIV